jgi:hypothetical protein
MPASPIGCAMPQYACSVRVYPLMFRFPAGLIAGDRPERNGFDAGQVWIDQLCFDGSLLSDTVSAGNDPFSGCPGPS